MTHEEIKILISAYFDGEVTPSEKNIVEEHLSKCQECQKDFKMYMAMSSSLSKWSNESLSPDEEIKVQKRFEQRREPMFTKRNLMALGTTLVLTILVGSVFQNYTKGQLQARARNASIYMMGYQGRLKASASDIGDQYSDANTRVASAASTQYEPYYVNTSYRAGANYDAAKQLRSVVVGGSMAQEQSYPNNASYFANKSPVYPGVLTMAAAAGSLRQQFPMRKAFKDDEYDKSSINNDHKVIKNANITLMVQDAQKTQTELEGLVTKFNGIIINFQMYKMEDASRHGLMVFNVLPKDLSKAMIELRKLGEVQSENQSGVDITNQYQYLQARLADYQSTKDHLQKILNKNVNDIEDNLNVQAQLSGVEANMNAIENSIKYLDDQSYMATVVVNFYDTVKPPEVKKASFKDQIAASFKENFKSTIQTCYDIGINSFSGIVILLSFLLQVLIWSLLFWVIYLGVSRLFKK